jgi:hypothetical protein
VQSLNEYRDNLQADERAGHFVAAAACWHEVNLLVYIPTATKLIVAVREFSEQLVL